MFYARFYSFVSDMLPRMYQNLKSLYPTPNERIPLVHYTLALTGSPPLVVRSDASASGEPDFEGHGVPLGVPVPAFFMADPHEGAEPPPPHHTRRLVTHF